MVLYYLHLFDNAAWFYSFRSLPMSEVTAAGAGLIAGVFAADARMRRLLSERYVLAVLCIGIVLPHVKPILSPVSDTEFQDRWTQDVCLQSTPSSCGPASAATLLRMLGHTYSERDIARICFTSGRGTENWYLARLFAREGHRVTFMTAHTNQSVPVPSIAGVRVSGIGHFIPILQESGTSYVTGDPLAGRQEWPKSEIRQHFEFTGFFMAISPQIGSANSRRAAG